MVYIIVYIHTKEQKIEIYDRATEKKSGEKQGEVTGGMFALKADIRKISTKKHLLLQRNALLDLWEVL